MEKTIDKEIQRLAAEFKANNGGRSPNRLILSNLNKSELANELGLPHADSINEYEGMKVCGSFHPRDLRVEFIKDKTEILRRKANVGKSPN